MTDFAESSSPSAGDHPDGREVVNEVPPVALEDLARTLPDRINVDPEHVENGLARLVLTVIELLRQVLEHQAIRRMDGGSLSEEQIERLGLALLKLSERMEDLKKTFGLTDEDLNV